MNASWTQTLRAATICAFLTLAIVLTGCRNDDSSEEASDTPEVEMEQGALFVDDVFVEVDDDGALAVTLIGHYPNACSVIGEVTTTVRATRSWWRPTPPSRSTSCAPSS